MSNGPAFPTKRSERDGGHFYEWTEDGMSMRDYFAAAVMPGVLNLVASYQGSENIVDVDASKAVRIAYKTADEMLKQRQE